VLVTLPNSQQGYPALVVPSFEAREYISYAGLSPEGKYIYVVGNPEDLQLQQTKNISQWGASVTLRYSF